MNISNIFIKFYLIIYIYEILNLLYYNFKKRGYEFILKKDITRNIITVLLGLCIVLARIVYPTHVDITKTTVVIEFLLELIICLSIIFINRNQIKEIFSQKIEHKGKFFLKILATWAIMFFGTTILNIIVQIIYGSITGVPLAEAYAPAAEVANIFMNTFFLPILLVQCILAPIEEELVFRYAFRKIFKKDNFISIFLYVVISSWLFGFIHSASLFAPGMITYICTGLVLSLTYLKFKDIRLLIGAHMFNNSLIWIVSLIASLV